MSPKRNILRRAFSLIEVVVATAVFATAIVAVIGLMTPLSRGVEDVLDSETAASLANNIQAELRRLGFATVSSEILASAPIHLYATADGGRVLRGPSPAAEAASTAFAVNQDLVTGTPAGIAKRDRYFLITLEDAALNGVPFDPNNSGCVTLRTTVSWPYRLPGGPATALALNTDPGFDESILAAISQRQELVLFFGVVP